MRSDHTLAGGEDVILGPRVTPAGVVCQCDECDCERIDRGLSYETSSRLVCLSCCLGRHKREPNRWCPTCDSRLPERLTPALIDRLTLAGWKP